VRETASPWSPDVKGGSRVARRTGIREEFPDPTKSTFCRVWSKLLIST
jgi:hypothetical protein